MAHPSKLADMVIFLASGRLAYMMARTIFMDGRIVKGSVSLSIVGLFDEQGAHAPLEAGNPVGYQGYILGYLIRWRNNCVLR